jgi:hypothetical protein
MPEGRAATWRACDWVLGHLLQIRPVAGTWLWFLSFIYAGSPQTGISESNGGLSLPQIPGLGPFLWAPVDADQNKSGDMPQGPALKAGCKRVGRNPTNQSADLSDGHLRLAQFD